MRALLYFSIIGLVTFLGSCSQTADSERVAFIENVRVFEEFDLKKSYDGRIEKDMSADAAQLDSLEAFFKSNAPTATPEALAGMKRNLLIAQEYYDKKFQELSTKYTQEVNERLNTFIKEYCEEKNIAILLGSAGQGNVMYVKDSLNVTDDIIKYVNKKYAE